MSNQPTGNFTPSLREIVFCVIERERQRVAKQVRRAEGKGLPSTLTLRQWLVILHHFGWRCAHCQRIGFQTLDHLVPVCKGGGTTHDNCVPACERCNHERDRVRQGEERMVEVLRGLHKVDC